MKEKKEVLDGVSTSFYTKTFRLPCDFRADARVHTVSRSRISLQLSEARPGEAQPQEPQEPQEPGAHQATRAHDPRRESGISSATSHFPWLLGDAGQAPSHRLKSSSEHTHPAGRGSGAFAGSPGSAAFSFLRLVSFLLQITVPNALHFLESLCMSWFLFQQSTDAKTESRRADEKQNDTTTAPPITSSHPPQRFL